MFVFKRRRHLYMAIIDIIFFLVAGSYIMPQWSAWYHLQSSSTLTTAIVMDRHESRVTRSIGQVTTTEPYYSITYGFNAQTPSGQTAHFTRDQAVVDAMYRQLPLGASVSIRYVHDNPSISVIENDQSNSALIFWTSLVLGHWGLHLLIVLSELIRAAQVRITFAGKEY
jgi:hypothetical protein